MMYVAQDQSRAIVHSNREHANVRQHYTFDAVSGMTSSMIKWMHVSPVEKITRQLGVLPSLQPRRREE